MYRIEHYLTEDLQRELFSEWLQRLRDRQGRVAVVRRVTRLEHGNFGDCRFCRDGVWELRLDVGPGYRVYYARSGQRVVLLLCGGDKHTQSADIDRAVSYWQDWQRRADDEKQTP
jgi:putative addiction module killer protein